MNTGGGHAHALDPESRGAELVHFVVDESRRAHLEQRVIYFLEVKSVDALGVLTTRSTSDDLRSECEEDITEMERT